MHAAMIRCFFLMCDSPDVGPDDRSESNYKNSFAIGVFKERENIEIPPTNNSDNENCEVRYETSYGGQKNEFTI